MSFSYTKTNTSEKYFLKRKSVASEASHCLSNSAKKLIVVQCFLALKRFVGIHGQEYMGRGYVVVYLISHPYG